MIMKHTPGPWEEWSKGGNFSTTGHAAAASYTAMCAIGEFDKDCAVEVVADGTNVAIALGNTKEEAEANARLIAAAPELLDELIEQDKFLGVLAGTVPLSEKDTHRRIAMHRESVRAAIAKATGSV